MKKKRKFIRNELKNWDSITDEEVVFPRCVSNCAQASRLSKDDFFKAWCSEFPRNKAVNEIVEKFLSVCFLLNHSDFHRRSTLTKNTKEHLP